MALAHEAGDSSWQAYWAGNTEARKVLVVRYLPLVKRVCGRMAISLPPWIDHGDLESAGTIGLMEAITAFRPERGVKFETFAVARIRGAIIDSLRKLDFVPRTVRQKAKRLQCALEDWYVSRGRYPEPDELAAALGITVGEMENWWLDVQSTTVISLNTPLDDGVDGGELLDMLPDSVDPLEHLLEGEHLQDLTTAIEELGERERLLLSLYYSEGLTLKELGRVLNISESRASQLHSSIMLKLRARLNIAEGKRCGKR